MNEDNSVACVQQLVYCIVCNGLLWLHLTSYNVHVHYEYMM